jgi:radical SAM superfamily enzyme YgiQ (UPF0313 family)
MPENVTQEFLNLIRLPAAGAKRLRYLLVIPRFVSQDDMSYQFPTGFALVSSALKASGRDVYTLNLNYKADYLELLRRTVVENAIDVVATGGLSGQYTALKEIIDAAKAANPEVITICGGGIITADPQASMIALETADYGVIGEGEITVNELAYALETGADASTVAGLALNNGITTGRRLEIANLDCLPFPDYDGFEFEQLLRTGLSSTDALALETTNVAISRSCPYNCTFCFHTSGIRYRRRSLDNVFREIDWLIAKYELTRFTFADELFINDKKVVDAFCERIKPYNLTWWAQTRVDTVTEDILRQLKDAGCYTISYGVESADNDILKSMRKKITVEQINRAFDAANNIGLPCYGNLIFGDLEETEQTLSHSLSWRNAHPDYDIRVGWILTYPGSHLYKIACQCGIISDPVQYLRDGCPQINVSKMSDDVYWEMVRRVELYKILYALGQKPDIMLISFEEIGRKLDGLLEYGKIAVWPATLRSIEMLHSISSHFAAAENVYFVNLDPNSQWVNGLERFGKEVYTPDIIGKLGIETVLYPYQSMNVVDIFAQITDMVKRSYTTVTRMIKIGDLLEH